MGITIPQSEKEAGRPIRARVKAAELASGIGAIVLGAGLALLAPTAVRSLAVPVVVIGIVVHGVGMTLKLRFESAEGPPAWWETLLFWICWACLGGLSAWLLVRWPGA